MRWRLLVTPPLGGAENMAVDETLLRRAADTGEAVFRVYAWAGPTLSLGRNQPARDGYEPAALRDHGVSVVRRLTGGRAVLHHREVTYSVTAPDALGCALRDAYRRINEIIMSGLCSLGLDAAIAAPSGRAPLPSTAPCFEEPTEGELVLGGRKLVGSAQYRESGALLQHGSILVDDDQALVAELLREPVAPPPPPATLHQALGRIPQLDEVAAALFNAVRAREDPGAGELVPDHLFSEGVAAATERYRDDRWTWRR
ncbi:MAG TPA: lipoate--protein ligase family protein [Gemmatimonadaceae bacterium]|nr:lipoate--protein ligase family protein [Gemmatimonadaceae bacterium]